MKVSPMSRKALTAPPGPLADALAVSLRRGGVELTTEPGLADAVVWCSTSPKGLPELLEAAPGCRWVQLPYAGIERFLSLVDTERTWTCAKDVYGRSVAELVLGLLVVAFRRLDRYVVSETWAPLPEQTLYGSEITILGGGGIGRSLTRLLLPLGAGVTVVSRSGAPIDGATTLPADETKKALPGADAVVLAVPLTPATTGLVDRSFLSAMKPSAWLVNVARGPVVVTDDLVAALTDGTIAGAALDVTDPEPLPDGHPLWRLDNAIVTPHVANTPALGTPVLAALVADNAARFAAGRPLAGTIDPTAGY